MSRGEIGNCTIFMCRNLRKENDWVTEYSRIILKQIVRKYCVLRFSVSGGSGYSQGPARQHRVINLVLR